MARTKKQTQKTRRAEAREPFAAVAERLGNALADVATHPGCPEYIYDTIVALDTDVFNGHPDIEISLRYAFAKLLVGVIEQPA